MSDERDSAFELVELLKRKAPEYLDLISAQNDADFDKAFDALLERAVIGLETNSKNFQPLNEVALSGVLKLAIEVPGLSVTQESHSNGHVDLTFEMVYCVPVRRKLGEAKIYDGPAYHFSGLEQLLGRYTTGREGRGLLITYFRKPNIAGLIQKLRMQMNKDRPCRQEEDTSDHRIKWSFFSKHAHSSGESLEVGHIGCNLYLDSGAPSTSPGS